MENIRRRRDRIRPQEEVLTCFLGCSNETERRRSVARYGGIDTLLLTIVTRLTEANLVYTKCHISAVVVTVNHHFRIRSDERRFLLELILQQVNRFIHGFVEQPADKTQGEHVSALEHGFIIHAGVLQRLFGQRRQGYRHNLYTLGDTQFRKRVIGMILRFFQVLICQAIGIYQHDGMTMIQRKLLIVVRLRMVEMRA